MTNPDQTDPGQSGLVQDPAQPQPSSMPEHGATRSLADEVAHLRFRLLEIDDLRGENRRLLSATWEMRAENMALNRALDGSVMPEELRQLQLQVADLNKRLDLAHSSLSWRITAPLRALARAFRFGRQ